jgi:pseudouridine-5'-phosphate glycosidase
MTGSPLDVRPGVADALHAGQPVVALETTLIAHGLPWPVNLETARQAEAAVRAEGAVPATVAVWHGLPTVGLDDGEIEQLARMPGVRKASRRDLAAAVAQGACAATTVSATMLLAHLAGVRVFATGGIGGVHRVEGGGWRVEGKEAAGSSTSTHHPPPSTHWDVSADLIELARTPVVVVCAGAKSILDLSATLEALETHGVPVLGYGTEEFPAFYLRTSGLRVSARVDSPDEAAAVAVAHWRLGGAGVVLARPIPEEAALDPEMFGQALREAEEDAVRQGVRGAALTPFLLARLAERTGGRTLDANRALIVANATLAARLAGALTRGGMAGEKHPSHIAKPMR